MKRSQVCLKKKFFFINQKFAHNYFHNYLEIYDRTFSEIYFTYNYFQLKYPALSTNWHTCAQSRQSPYIWIKAVLGDRWRSDLPKFVLLRGGRKEEEGAAPFTAWNNWSVESASGSLEESVGALSTRVCTWKGRRPQNTPRFAFALRNDR